MHSAATESLRLVGSLKLYVSFAEYGLFYRVPLAVLCIVAGFQLKSSVTFEHNFALANRTAKYVYIYNIHIQHIQYTNNRTGYAEMHESHPMCRNQVMYESYDVTPAHTIHQNKKTYA